LDTLFLAMPVSWHGTLQQYVGRLHRDHDGKSVVQVYDYVDRNVPMLFKMHQRRLKKYPAIGYAIEYGDDSQKANGCLPVCLAGSGEFSGSYENPDIGKE
jgi:superfamily II DNA or RNA helicase